MFDVLSQHSWAAYTIQLAAAEMHWSTICCEQQSKVQNMKVTPANAMWMKALEGNQGTSATSVDQNQGNDGRWCSSKKNIQTLKTINLFKKNQKTFSAISKAGSRYLDLASLGPRMKLCYTLIPSIGNFRQCGNTGFQGFQHQMLHTKNKQICLFQPSNWNWIQRLMQNMTNPLVAP